MSKPEEIVLDDADTNRIDRVLADIEGYCHEIQMAPAEHDAGITDLLAETKRCQLLTQVEIDNVIAETEARREAATVVDAGASQRPRRQWQFFVAGFAFGVVCFVVAVTLSRSLGYPSTGLVIFWLVVVPAAAFFLLRRKVLSGGSNRARSITAA
jgi:hypothetical protein